MSLYSLDPWDFAQADFQMEQYEKREEWHRLHGDGQPPKKKLENQDATYSEDRVIRW